MDLPFRTYSSTGEHRKTDKRVSRTDSVEEERLPTIYTNSSQTPDATGREDLDYHEGRGPHTVCSQATAASLLREVLTAVV